MENIVKRIQEGETRLIEPFIRQRINFISSFANKYSDMFGDCDDLLQEATIAFVRAIYNYKFGQSSFYQYAAIKIHSTIRKYVISNIDRITDLEKKYYFVKYIYEKCREHIGHELSYADVSKYFGIEVSESQNICNIYLNRYTHFNIDAFEDYYNDYSLEDVLEKVDSDIFIESVMKKGLNTREQDVLKIKYNNEGLELRDGEIAKIVGISRQGVVYRIKNAQDKLRIILKKEMKSEVQSRGTR